MRRRVNDNVANMSLRIFGAHAAKLRLGPCASCPSAVDIGRIHDTASSSFRGHRDYANNSVTNSSTIVSISEPSSWVWNNDETRTTWTMMGSYSSLLSGGFGAVKLVSNPPIVAGFAQSTVRSMSSSSSSSSSKNVAERIEQFRNGKPTLAYAKTLPRTFAMMTNEQVLLFAEQGIPEACRECIVRDIMVVDQVEYDEAKKVFEQIRISNRQGMAIFAMPFRIGVFLSITGAVASLPLVFDRAAVEWFNDMFVTAEMPPEHDLETVLEVGSAAWAWMEPVLGTVSFYLLCMQFARAQLQNLGLRPYFSWQQDRRADRLVRLYPRYHAVFLRNYSKCDPLADPHELVE